MVVLLAARNSRGMIVRPLNNSLDLCVLWVVHAAGQGALTGLLTRGWTFLPGGLCVATAAIVWQALLHYLRSALTGRPCAPGGFRDVMRLEGSRNHKLGHA